MRGDYPSYSEAVVHGQESLDDPETLEFQVQRIYRRDVGYNDSQPELF